MIPCSIAMGCQPLFLYFVCGACYISVYLQFLKYAFIIKKTGLNINVDFSKLPYFFFNFVSITLLFYPEILQLRGGKNSTVCFQGSCIQNGSL